MAHFASPAAGRLAVSSTASWRIQSANRGELCVAERQFLDESGTPKINLDPCWALAYVPRHAWPHRKLGRAESTNCDCLGPASGACATARRLCGPSDEEAGMDAGRIVGKHQSHTARHTRMCVAPSNRSRNPRNPLPPSDRCFRGLFYAPTTRAVTSRPAHNRLRFPHSL
jgi:hypothetical protein